MASDQQEGLKPILSFLQALEKNNNKAWFDKNRASYEKAKSLFEGLVDRIILEYGQFENLSVISAKAFQQYFGTVEGEKLKTVPQGYGRDHPELEILRLKEVVAVHHLSDEMVLSSKLESHVIEAFRAMKPFLDYLNSVAP